MTSNTQRIESAGLSSLDGYHGEKETDADAATPTPKRVVRRVTVIMPFRSGNRYGERLSILNYMRIKYIVENMVKVTPLWCDDPESNQYIKYKVDVFKTGAGEISEMASKRIVDAHLIIALINEINVNVVYELAMRHLLKESLIIIKDTKDGLNAVPVYLQNFAHIDYQGSEGSPDRPIISKMEYLANQEADEVRLEWEQGNNYPPDLMRLIEKKDTRLSSELQRNIQDFEDEKIVQPAFIRDIATVVHPSQAFSSWSTISPYSVIRILWEKKRDSISYHPDDMLEDPVITCCNEAFLRMLNRNGALPNPRSDQKLTAKIQLEYLKRHMDEEAYSALCRDQNQIFESLFLRDDLTHAVVPIEFNGSHPEFSNKAFLPCLFGKKIVGHPSSPHYAYFVVCFVESFHSIGELKTMPQHSHLFAAADEQGQEQN